MHIKVCGKTSIGLTYYLVRVEPDEATNNLKLRNIVASKLILDRSPKQISGWLKTQYPDDESMRVSHETIYRSLFIQARAN